MWRMHGSGVRLALGRSTHHPRKFIQAWAPTAAIFTHQKMQLEPAAFLATALQFMLGRLQLVSAQNTTHQLHRLLGILTSGGTQGGITSL